MPYVIKDARGRSPYWYAVFRDATGRRLKKTTKMTSKSQALRLAHDWQRVADKARRGELTERWMREIISDITASVNSGDGLPTYSIRKWFEHFYKIKAKASDPAT